MATDAAGFLHGTPPGTPDSWFDFRFALIVIVMAAAVTAAICGVTRITTSWPELDAA